MKVERLRASLRTASSSIARWFVVNRRSVDQSVACGLLIHQLAELAYAIDLIPPAFCKIREKRSAIPPFFVHVSPDKSI
ncbi:MAG: hypothetical protein K0R28_6064 [Paenibacillus sp.]|jgi:hypothetical protein|nr:hypothetical protein [Paenibacillus sp.]